MMKFLVLVSLAAIGLGGFGAHAVLPSRFDVRLPACNLQSIERLPKNIVPTNYGLMIRPDLGAMSAEGKVRISVEIREQKGLHLDLDGRHNTRHIYLHVDDVVDIKSVEMTTLLFDNRIIGVCKDPERQLLDIEVREKLQVGEELNIYVEFATKIRRDMRGIYLSEYKGSKYIVSQFQGGDVRLVFPSFDEPQFKADIDLTLSLDPELTAISGTSNHVDAVETVRDADGNEKEKKLWIFSRAKSAALDLIGFVVGDFGTLKATTESGTEVWIHAVPSRVDKMHFALEVALQAVKYMEDYLGTKLPLHRINIVAIPDHAKGNTENFGLPIIRDTLLTFDADTFETNKLTTAIVVSHVIAHQYFANWVTHNWWSDLWVTEGAAAYLAYEFVRAVHPEFSLDPLIRTSLVTNHLQLDGTGRENAVSPHWRFESSGEIYKIYTSFEFQKSVSIMKLISNQVGAGKFQEGLRRVVQHHKFATISTKQFVDAIAEASGWSEREMSHLVYPWIEQSNFPIVSVDISGKKVQLQQEPFAGKPDLIKDVLHGKFSRSLWTIPLRLEFTDGQSRSETAEIRLTDSSLRVKPPAWFQADVEGANTYVIVNPDPDYSNFYRIRYSQKLLDRMAADIEGAKVQPAVRAKLLDDANHLVQNKKIGEESFQKLVAWHSEEHDDEVMIALLLATKTKSAQKPAYQDPKQRRNPFVTSIQTHGYKATGEESIMTQRVRQVILSAFMDKDLIPILPALEEFERTSPLPVFVRAPIYSAVVRSKAKHKISILLDRLETTDSYDEQLRLASALALIDDDSEALARVFNWLSEKSDFRPDDAMSIVTKMKTSAIGQALIAVHADRVAVWEKAPKQVN